ncbi:MAG: acyl-ACP thioesterase domain-containing protein [Acidimicrobiales bacterium]
MIEFVPLATPGRHFTRTRRVRLGDADVDGVLRPDGVARYLQDVAGDDADDTVVISEEVWVVRRTAMRVAAGGAWPRLGEEVTLTTWCSGTGAAWAERRTDLRVGERLMMESVALWVPVDPTGRPVRLRPSFFDVYGEAAAGRHVSGRVTVVAPPASSAPRPWCVRRSDLDVIGHVNNAAVWSALSEVATESVRYASLVHHGPIGAQDDVMMVHEPGRVWLLVDGDVRVAGEYRVE